MHRAFYLLAPGGWRDYVNLLHTPYTAWHLSYVLIGASLVAAPDFQLLGWTLLAFFLALGLGAHAIDELHGRPLATSIPTRVLWSIGITSTISSTAIGITVGLASSPYLLIFIITGVFLVFAYNREWALFHHDFVFALAWGAFPVLTSYFAQSGSLNHSSITIALAAAATSFVQRTLSKRVRYLRRKVINVSGHLVEYGGAETIITREWLILDHERVLIVLSVAMPALAIGLLIR